MGDLKMDKVLLAITVATLGLTFVPGIFSFMVRNSQEFQELETEYKIKSQQLEDQMQYTGAYKDGVQDAN